MRVHKELFPSKPKQKKMMKCFQPKLYGLERMKELRKFHRKIVLHRVALKAAISLNVTKTRFFNTCSVTVLAHFRTLRVNNSHQIMWI